MTGPWGKRQIEGVSKIILAAVLGALALLGTRPAAAQGGDYASKLGNMVNECAVVCLDDRDLQFFGALTVPFDRPSVEWCGEVVSLSDTERAQRIREERAQADREVRERQYSPKEQQLLRKKLAEKWSKCDADLERRCKETRASVSLEERRAAVARTKKEIADAGEAGRSAALSRYLAAVLAKCPLEE